MAEHRPGDEADIGHRTALNDRTMSQPHAHLAYAPRGAGLLYAVMWIAISDDIYGWFIGSKDGETLAIEVCGDCHVLEHRREFVSDLLVDGRVHLSRFTETHTPPPAPSP